MSTERSVNIQRGTQAFRELFDGSVWVGPQAQRDAEHYFARGYADALARQAEAAECRMVSEQLRLDFAELVTARLCEGWRLHGQPFHASGQYHQLMTRGVQP